MLEILLQAHLDRRQEDCWDCNVGYHGGTTCLGYYLSDSLFIPNLRIRDTFFSHTISMAGVPQQWQEHVELPVLEMKVGLVFFLRQLNVYQ